MSFDGYNDRDDEEDQDDNMDRFDGLDRNLSGGVGGDGNPRENGGRCDIVVNERAGRMKRIRERTRKGSEYNS